MTWVLPVSVRMLRIGKLTDYAMLILNMMAKTPNAILSTPFLAEALHLSAPTVSKVLKILSDADLVTSIRGAEGGYRLARLAADITVADVITAMEGDLAITACCEGVGLCAIDSMCAMRENWQKINRMIHALLSRLTIIDMSNPLIIKNMAECTSTG
ncbi:MAG: SUF system Fe-S cluster assembly regulator [Gammaproteobacteria bacterium]|nr:SUF system Fe-S cluster assembly regulator [Gammaproteobacteria bacterium]MCW5582891.1 SUF system Fe-S cluster assembly regulator [Gammaproteobacteria bacterium]